MASNSDIFRQVAGAVDIVDIVGEHLARKKGGGGGGGGRQRDQDGLTPGERIAKTNEWACGFFERHLRTTEGKAGLEYLRGRGLTDETMGRFRLGMSPDGWTGMVNAAMRLGV